MTEEAVVISVDSTDVELAAARFDQLRGASEAAAEGLDDVGAAGEDAAEGLDDAADGAERLGRQSAGSTLSVGKLTAGIVSGAVALQAIKAAFRLGLAAVREYAAGNAEAQQQVDAVAASTREARLALGALIIRFGEASGIAAALTATLRGLGAAMDAISGRSATGLAVPRTADALARVREQAAAAARDVAEYQSQVDRLTDLQMMPGLRTDAVNASLDGLRERSRDLALYQAAIAEGSQIIAEQGAANVQRIADSIGEISGPIAAAGGGGTSEQAKRLADAIAAQNNARLIAEKQGIAEVNALRLQGMADSIRQFGELAEAQAQQLRDQAALELEIEASKNAAMAELRAQVKEQERRDAEERRETWQSLLGDMRNMAVSAGNALSQALGSALATGDGQSLRQSFRSIFAGVLADMGTMIQTIAIPMLIPSPFNPAFNPVAGGALLAAGFGLQALSGAFGAAGGGGGGSSPVSAPSAARDVPTRSRDGGNTEIYQSLSFGFVGDRRAVIREVYDVLADGRRLGMAQ